MSTQNAVVSLLVDGAPTLLDVEQVSLTGDESWQPYVQARVVAVGAAARFADPRRGHGLRVTLSDDAGGTITADKLGVRTVHSDTDAQTVTITAASDEARVQDLASIVPDLGPLSWPGIREALEDVLPNYLGVPADRVDVAAIPYLTSPDLVANTVVRTGDPWWPVVSDWPARAAWTLWVGFDGIWRVSESVPAYVPPIPTGTLAVAESIEQLTSDTTRDSGAGAAAWADAVVATYEWTDAANVRQRVVGMARTVAAPTRVLTVPNTIPVTQGQADARAQQILNLAAQRGRVLTVTVPVRFDVRPRAFWDVRSSATESVTIYVTGVTWDLPAGTCTVSGRVIAVALTGVRWIDVDPTLKWNQVPAGVRWIDVDTVPPTTREDAAA